MIVMGGAVTGGRVYGRWPGLVAEQRYEGRDLQVTTDFRDVLGEILQNRLENNNLGAVFPGYTPKFRGLVQKQTADRIDLPFGLGEFFGI